jgi:hypothetical protein
MVASIMAPAIGVPSSSTTLPWILRTCAEIGVAAPSWAATINAAVSLRFDNSITVRLKPDTTYYRRHAR